MVSIAMVSRAKAIRGAALRTSYGLHCGATYYAAHLVRRVHGGDDSGLVKGEEAAAPN